MLPDHYLNETKPVQILHGSLAILATYNESRLAMTKNKDKAYSSLLSARVHSTCRYLKVLTTMSS